ncbi:MAG TPA: hypothetical protein VF006_31645 [Longimicrobium sp.]
MNELDSPKNDPAWAERREAPFEALLRMQANRPPCPCTEEEVEADIAEAIAAVRAAARKEPSVTG